MQRLSFVLLTPALLAQDLSPVHLRAAAVRSLALLQKGCTGFSKAQDCFSCYHTGLPAGALELARERGIPVDEAAARFALVKPLLVAGADPKLRAKAGETALSQAKKYQYPHIQSALQKSGAQE